MTLSREELAEVIYNNDQRCHYGYVKTPWALKQWGAAKQHALKQAELILFDYDVSAKERT